MENTRLPVARFGTLVEPVLDDHKQPEGRDSAKKSQAPPEPWTQIEPVEQGRSCRRGGKHGEGPDVAHPLDQSMAHE